MFRGNLQNLTVAANSGAYPSKSFVWTINGGLSPINNIMQETDWDCASALMYDRVLTEREFLAVEFWLNEVRRALAWRWQGAVAWLGSMALMCHGLCHRCLLGLGST